MPSSLSSTGTKEARLFNPIKDMWGKLSLIKLYYKHS